MLGEELGRDVKMLKYEQLSHGFKTPDKSVCFLALGGLKTWKCVLVGVGREPFIHVFFHSFKCLFSAY